MREAIPIDLVNEVIAAATDVESLIQFADANRRAREDGVIAHLAFNGELAERQGNGYLAAQYRRIAQVLTGSQIEDAADRLLTLLRCQAHLHEDNRNEDVVRKAGLSAAHVAADGFWQTLHADAAVSALDTASSVLAVVGRQGHNEPCLLEAARVALAAYELALDSGRREGPAMLANSLGLRLSELYRVAGDPKYLNDAIKAARKAVELAANDDELVDHLANLGNALSDACYATGDRSLLEESIDVTELAVGKVTSDDRRSASLWSNRAMRRLELQRLTGDRSALDQAIDELERSVEVSGGRDVRSLRNLALALQRRSTDIASVTRSIELLERTVGDPADDLVDEQKVQRDIANLLVRMHELTGEITFVEQAIERCRRIAGVVSTANPASGAIALTLIQALMTLARATDSKEPLAEADRVIRALDDSLHTIGSNARVALGRAAGRLARMREEPGEAAVRFGRAYDELRRESRRLGSHRAHQRELARTAPALLSNLVAALALSGDVEGAIEAAESARLWLPAAPMDLTERADVSVTWIVTTGSETVVIARGRLASVISEVTWDRLEPSASGVLDFARGGSGESGDLGDLLEMTSLVTEQLREARHHLLIPIGLSGLMPFSAGRGKDGRPLIETSTVTLAPSASWAWSTQRTRPLSAPSFGAFHEGHDPAARLHLDPDRTTFGHAYPHAVVLDQPSARDVIDHLGGDGLVAHLSCHGHFDLADPLSSYLDLADPLTLRAILEHDEAPWLVNLSACETGLSELITIDEMLSFPVGFLLAGAAHVIATQWAVSDEHATRYNARFYDELSAGAHPSAAHRRAVLTMADESPFYWGCFTHVGSPPVRSH